MMGDRKLKIAIWHNLPTGGGKRALHDQVRGLVGRGHVVEAWCPSTANQAFLPLGDLIKEHALPFEWRPLPEEAGFGYNLRLHRQMVRMFEAMDRHCRACAEQINRGGFDLLLAHPCMFFRVPPIARHVDRPGLIYLQEPNRRMYEAQPRLPWVAPPPPRGWPSPRYLKDFVSDLVVVHSERVRVREELDDVSAFDAILVNSYFSRESVLRAYGLDSRVCYLGVDTGAFRPTGDPKGRFVVGLGNIKDNKGLDVAVKAVGTIEAPRRPDLIWIGNFADPDYLGEIERLARDLGVRFIPKVLISDHELVGWLSRAAAMVYTSRLEPFGYAPLEASACGTAVVAVAEGGVRETVRDGVNGVLVGDSDPAEIGRALQTLCDDLDRAREVGTAARLYVEENWSLDQAMDRLEDRLVRFCREGRQVRLPDPEFVGELR